MCHCYERLFPSKVHQCHVPFEKRKVQLEKVSTSFKCFFPAHPNLREKGTATQVTDKRRTDRRRRERPRFHPRHTKCSCTHNCMSWDMGLKKQIEKGGERIARVRFSLFLRPLSPICFGNKGVKNWNWKNLKLSRIGYEVWVKVSNFRTINTEMKWKMSRKCSTYNNKFFGLTHETKSWR